MIKLGNLNIGLRLGLTFALLTLLAMALTGLAISRMHGISASLSVISQDRVPKVQRLDQIANNLNLIARELRNTLLLDDPALEAEALTLSIQARTEIAALIQQVEPGIRSAQGRQLLAQMLTARAAYMPLQTDFIELMQAGRREPARALLKDRMRLAQLNYTQAIDTLKSFQVGLIHAAAVKGERDYQQARLLLVLLLLALLLAAAGGGWLITRSITVPLRRAVGITETVAGGDLSARIAVVGSDETGQLLRALREMNASLLRVVGSVRDSADHIATGSRQIAVGNADLSQRTEEQAASLQQTAASVEQLAGSVRQNAESARQASQLAGSTSATATRGGALVGDVVTMMEAVLADVRQMADIIAVIDGIAFKTGILALNAAVEAARAGPQGRGFAVVAGEVRSLAGHAGTAAKQIRGLIGASVERAEAGAALVHSAGSTMAEVVSQVRQVSGLVADIDAATLQQAGGLGEINTAMAQLDQVTQQNAALVEQAAAAAESLDQQARRLSEAVGVFKIAVATPEA